MSSYLSSSRSATDPQIHMSNVLGMSLSARMWIGSSHAFNTDPRCLVPRSIEYTLRVVKTNHKSGSLWIRSPTQKQAAVSFL